MDKIIVPGTTGSAAGPTTTTTAATTISLKRGRRQRGSHGQRPAAESRHRGGLRQREVVVGVLPRILLLPSLNPPNCGGGCGCFQLQLDVSMVLTQSFHEKILEEEEYNFNFAHKSDATYLGTKCAKCF